MMNLVQFLLSRLAEEASEVSQIALKAQQYGIDEKWTDSPRTNAERIHIELDDVLALVELLNDHGFNFVSSPARRNAKKQKIFKYLKYSIERGQVDPQVRYEFILN